MALTNEACYKYFLDLVVADANSSDLTVESLKKTTSLMEFLKLINNAASLQEVNEQLCEDIGVMASLNQELADTLQDKGQTLEERDAYIALTDTEYDKVHKKVQELLGKLASHENTISQLKDERDKWKNIALSSRNSSQSDSRPVKKDDGSKKKASRSEAWNGSVPVANLSLPSIVQPKVSERESRDKDSSSNIPYAVKSCWHCVCYGLRDSIGNFSPSVCSYHDGVQLTKGQAEEIIRGDTFKYKYFDDGTVASWAPGSTKPKNVLTWHEDKDEEFLMATAKWDDKLKSRDGKSLFVLRDYVYCKSYR